MESDLLAGPAGFEPVISGVTNRCVRPLHHGPGVALAAQRESPSTSHHAGSGGGRAFIPSIQVCKS